MANKKHIKGAYDDFADVLYLTSGIIARTKNMEEEAGLVLRYDAKTLKPVGATIVDYKEYWLPKRQHLVHRLSRFFGISFEDANKVISATRQ